MIKKATRMEVSTIKSIIEENYTSLEWHHAGKLPKSYGGVMKKTYFVNSKEMQDLASNWYIYVAKYQEKLTALSIKNKD